MEAVSFTSLFFSLPSAFPYPFFFQFPFPAFVVPFIARNWFRVMQVMQIVIIAFLAFVVSFVRAKRGLNLAPVLISSHGQHKSNMKKESGHENVFT